MAVSVVMPALEMAQETGKLIAWRKREGEEVRKGEPLLEIETEKAVMEIEAPADGILAGIKAEIGAVIPVGETIAWIVRPGEAPPAVIPQSELPQAARSEPARPYDVRPAAEADKSQRPRMSPKARRLARELGVDTSSLRGSGPGEALLARDIQKSREETDARVFVPAAAISSVGRWMAERTTQSWTEIPHFFLSREVHAAPLVGAREKRNGDDDVRQHAMRLTITDLLIQLVARVLPRHPRLNASWTPEGLRLHPAVHISLAVAVEGGVVSVVVRDAHRSSLAEIARRRRELAEKARAHRLRPADIRDGTFTLSNLGMYEVDAFQAIIYPPQAAILAVGRIADRVVAVEKRPAIRAMMTLTLSCDHRIVDGAQGALFLKDLAAAIENPAEWLE